MKALPPIFAYVGELRNKLDHNHAYDLLNDPGFRDAMKAFVKGSGQGHRNTRADLAGQAFLFAIELERQRLKTQLQYGTWPCHDHAPPDATVHELMALAGRADAD